MNTVIYHSADYDGIFCRKIAKKFLPPDTEFIGWNFGQPKVPMPAEGTVYILDLSPECLCDNPAIEGTVWNRIVWIDHHKTAIEKWPSSIRGYRIDGVAACRLAWQWFAEDDFRRKHPEKLPDKHAYVDRLVSEPHAVQLAGEYDIWDKRDPNAEIFQYGLRSLPMDCYDIQVMLQDSAAAKCVLEEVLERGEICMDYGKRVDADTCRNRTWIMPWEGLNFLCVNSARFNSGFFAARDVPETGHDALLGFCFDGRCWTVSLYHAKHNTGLDLSVIAKKHGGGGHKGACGFTCKELPFNLINTNP